MVLDWSKVEKEFCERLENAVPNDLKDFVGLIDGKGYCPLCTEKKVLFLVRATKKSYCSDCLPAVGYEYSAVEFNNMWQIAQDVLYYANEKILELSYPNLDFKSVTPEKVEGYLTIRGWEKQPFGNPNVWKFTKTFHSFEFTTLVPIDKSIEIDALVPNRDDLVDYHRALELAFEVIAKVEKISPYEVFRKCSEK